MFLSKSSFPQHLSVEDKEIVAVNGGFSGGLELDVIGKFGEDKDTSNCGGVHSVDNLNVTGVPPSGMKDTCSSICSTTFHKWRVERMIIMLPTSAWAVFLISIESLFGLSLYKPDPCKAFVFHFNEMKRWQKKNNTTWKYKLLWSDGRSAISQ